MQNLTHCDKCLECAMTWNRYDAGWHVVCLYCGNDELIFDSLTIEPEFAMVAEVNKASLEG